RTREKNRFTEEPDYVPEPKPVTFRRQPEPEPIPELEEIPICPLEDDGPPWQRAQTPEPLASPAVPAPETEKIPHPVFVLPSTDLLNEAQGRSPYDEQELKETATRVVSKFEEFNVHGSVVQINPGPVVTTFEFKPEA